LAVAAPLSPATTIGIAILFGGVATADSGTINTGLFAFTDPGRAACVAPVLFGVLLDLAGGSHRALAWIIAFATEAAINMAPNPEIAWIARNAPRVWPLSYLLKRK
jgi:hypothetical protein